MGPSDDDDGLYPLTLRTADGQVRNSPEVRLNAHIMRRLGTDEEHVAEMLGGYSPEPFEPSE